VRPGFDATVPSRLSAKEAQPHLTVGIVPIRVDEADGLPGAEFQPAADHRQSGVRRDEGRQDMVPAVAGAAVPVLPAVVGGQQRVQRGEQVVVAARAGLDDGNAGRGV
jgi:hypothetical protein